MTCRGASAPHRDPGAGCRLAVDRGRAAPALGPGRRAIGPGSCRGYRQAQFERAAEACRGPSTTTCRRPRSFPSRPSTVRCRSGWLCCDWIAPIVAAPERLPPTRVCRPARRLLVAASASTRTPKWPKLHSRSRRQLAAPRGSHGTSTAPLLARGSRTGCVGLFVILDYQSPDQARPRGTSAITSRRRRSWGTWAG